MNNEISNKAWHIGKNINIDFELVGDNYQYDSRNASERGVSHINNPNGEILYLIDDGAIRGSNYNIIDTFIPNMNLYQPYMLIPIGFNNAYAVISTQTETIGVYIENNEVIRRDIILEFPSTRIAGGASYDLTFFNLILHSENRNVFYLKKVNTLTGDLEEFQDTSISEQALGFNSVNYGNGFLKFNETGDLLLNSISSPYNLIEIYSFDICTGRLQFIERKESITFKHTPHLYGIEWANDKIIFTSNNKESKCEDPLGSISYIDYGNGTIGDVSHIIDENIHFGDIKRRNDITYISRYGQHELGVLNDDMSYDIIYPNDCPTHSNLTYSLPNIPYLSNQVALPLSISTEDNLLICEGSDTEVLLFAIGTFQIYNWYFNGELIDGELTNELLATEAGEYHVVAWNTAPGPCGVQVVNYSISEIYSIQTDAETDIPDIEISTQNPIVYCEGNGDQVQLTYNTPNFNIDEHNSSPEGIFDQTYPFGSDPFEIRWYRDSIEIENTRNQTNILVSEQGDYTARIVRLNSCEAYNESNIISIVYTSIDPPSTGFTSNASASGCPSDGANIYSSTNVEVGVTYQWIKDEEILSTERRFIPFEIGEYKLRVTKEISGCSAYSEETFIVETIDQSEFFIYTENDNIYCANEKIENNLIPDFESQLDSNLFNLKWYKNGVLYETTNADESINVIEEGVYKAILVPKQEDCNFQLESNEIEISRINKPNTPIISVTSSGSESIMENITILNSEEYIDLEFNLELQSSTISDWIGDSDLALGENNLSNDILRIIPSKTGIFEYKKEVVIGEEDCKKPCYYTFIKTIEIIEDERPEVIVENESGCETLDGSAFIDLKNTSVDDWDIVWSNGETNIDFISNLRQGTYIVTIENRSNPDLRYTMGFVITREETCEEENASNEEFILSSQRPNICNQNFAELSVPFEENTYYRWYRNNEIIQPARPDAFTYTASKEGMYKAEKQKIIGEIPDNTRWIESNELEIIDYTSNSITPIYALYNDEQIYSNLVIPIGERVTFRADDGYSIQSVIPSANNVIENGFAANEAGEYEYRFTTTPTSSICLFEQSYNITVVENNTNENLVEFDVNNVAGQTINNFNSEIYVLQPNTESSGPITITSTGDEFILYDNPNSDVIKIDGGGNFTHGIIREEGNNNPLTLTENDEIEIKEDVTNAGVYFDFNDDGTSPLLPIDNRTNIKLYGGDSNQVTIEYLPYLKSTDNNIENNQSIAFIANDDWGGKVLEINPEEESRNPIIETTLPIKRQNI